MMVIKSSVAEARNESVYSAGGQKLRVTQKWNSSFSTAPVIGSTINATALNMTKTTDYVGNLIYENNQLKRILVDGGYIEAGVYYYYLADHLGNNRIVAKQDGVPVQKTHYYPFGSSFAVTTGAGIQPYKYNGKELDQMHGLNLYDYSARYYESAIGRFTTPDPLAEKYYSISPYVYCNNNPMKFIDPDGKEPIKPQAGTARGFVHTFNTTGTYSGTKTGVAAHNAMLSYGKTDFKFPRPMPANTGKINNYADKYIYTENGGWIDMAHFMFYAGKAYQYKLDGNKNPIGKAVQDGYKQEFSDKFGAPHSAYSYEDLPSDKFGAEFGAKYFDPNSKQTFGEQLENYLNNVLKATDPTNAPNYNQLPMTEPTSKPSRINKTTTPVYTKDNP